MSDKSAADFAIESVTANVSLSNSRKVQSQNKSNNTALRVAKIAGTLVTGFAALLAGTIENRAENDNSASDDTLDQTQTSSLPEPSTDDSRQTIASSQDFPSIFQEVQSTEANDAEIRLASLFGEFEVANNEDENPTSHKSEKLNDDMVGSGGSAGISLVESTGVSNPAQTIGPLAQIGTVSPGASHNISNSSSSTTNIITPLASEDVDSEVPVLLRGTLDADVLSGGELDDALFGLEGDDTLSGGAGADMIDGGDGKDFADYSTSSEAVIVNLQSSDNTGGDAEGDQLVNIEGVIGSAFDDIITGHQNQTDYLFGGDGADQLFGMGGKDYLSGGAGADLIDGGEGDEDVAEYVGSKDGIHVSLLDGKGYAGDAEGDVLKNIEFIHGSMFDDIIEGDNNVNRLEGRAGDDILNGLGGNDRLLGGLGADTLDGGEGTDTADYLWSDHGVVVDLSTGLGHGGDAQGDVLTSIEFLAGSLNDDTLIGNDENNRLWGNDGDDILNGGAGNDRLDGGAGADQLIGGEGTDIADYSQSDASVVLDLATSGIAGDAAGDTYDSIETVYGSDFADGIAGDETDNRLVGNGGNDVLFGAGGNDYLLGGEGDDVLTGGTGADVFVFEGEFGNDTITDMWAGESRTDRIWLKGQGVDSWSELQSTMEQSGDDVILTVEHGTITLQDIQITDLHEDDFIFG